MKTKVVISKRFNQPIKVCLDVDGFAVSVSIESFIASLSSIALSSVAKQAAETIGNPLLLATNSMAATRLAGMSLERFKADLMASTEAVIGDMKSASVVAE